MSEIRIDLGVKRKDFVIKSVTWREQQFTDIFYTCLLWWWVWFCPRFAAEKNGPTFI